MRLTLSVRQFLEFGALIEVFGELKLSALNLCVSDFWCYA